eukprot:TRINITY_DN3665_c0_g1_i2.p1 TRINITY_DN3665_c0_g1~~TRINITY_DN3665_c0_g1_i2.p1  ORF type:complete len:159 (+),score=35.14 TRINITY_DN3665_c0_g1_i2:69-479(+)
MCIRDRYQRRVHGVPFRVIIHISGAEKGLAAQIGLIDKPLKSPQSWISSEYIAVCFDTNVIKYAPTASASSKDITKTELDDEVTISFEVSADNTAKVFIEGKLTATQKLSNGMKCHIFFASNSTNIMASILAFESL